LLARNINQRQELAIGLTGSEKPNVRYWHKADMLNALANVRFWGQADSDQPLLTDLDL
jgi:hypothetical protein